MKPGTRMGDLRREKRGTGEKCVGKSNEHGNRNKRCSKYRGKEMRMKR